MTKANRLAQHFFSVIWLVCLFLISVSASAEQAKKPPVSVVSVVKGEFKLPREARLAWHSGKQYQRSDKAQQKQVFERLRAEARAQFEAAGYRFVKREEADFLIAMTSVLESAINDDEIASLFGLRTLLSSSKSRHSKGTVILGILRPDEDYFRWRGAVQVQDRGKASALASPEMTTLAIERLLRKIPRKH